MKSFLPLAVVLLALGVWSQDCGVSERLTPSKDSGRAILHCIGY